MRHNLINPTEPDPVRVGRLWLFPDGTTLPVVRGGDGDDDENDEDKDGEPIKMSRKELNEMIAERIRKAQGSAKKDLLKQLGIEDVDAAKTALDDYRKIQDQSKTDLDRVTTEATTEKQKREAAEATVAEVKLTTRIEKALIKAGQTVTAAERCRKLIDLTSDASEDDIKAEIEALKKDTPALFSAPEGEGEGKPPAGKPNVPPPGRPPAQPAPKNSPQEAARNLLHQRHPKTKKN